MKLRSAAAVTVAASTEAAMDDFEQGYRNRYNLIDKRYEKYFNVFSKKVPDQTGIGIFCHCAAPDWFFMARFRELVTLGQKSRTFVHFT